MTFFWIEPVKSNANKVSCSRTQHHVPCEIRSRDLDVYGTLPSDLTVLSLVLPKWRLNYTNSQQAFMSISQAYMSAHTCFKILSIVAHEIVLDNLSISISAVQVREIFKCPLILPLFPIINICGECRLTYHAGRNTGALFLTAIKYTI